MVNPKFDLRQFNPAYFDRLRARVIAARERGIYVSIMLFEDWVFMAKRKDHPVELHPFHKDNNVSGINGDPERRRLGHRDPHAPSPRGRGGAESLRPQGDRNGERLG